MNRSSLGKIAVIGSGTVGCYYGGMLAHAGHDVHFLMRADLDTVRREGLRIFTKGNEVHLPRVQCAANANVADVLGDRTLRSEARALMDELPDAARRLGHAVIRHVAERRGASVAEAFQPRQSPS